ncbi:MAG TPA: tRNA pseudouridine(38-40) synthase TruA [Actinomycetales bacterium]|nr:tRNA pseudouridine(38-40) synthase TruA [Actinomycetales bacterium]
MRVRLGLGYDGTGFAGWAAQPGLRTVEQTLAEALQRVLRLPESPRLVVAGRTDSGVHARGQVCHVDLPEAAWSAAPGRSDAPPGAALVRRLAGVLPSDVRVTEAGVAPAGFDARFSAVARRYAYRVGEAPWGVDPLRRHDVLDHRRRLDVAAMDEAAGRLVGLHDFAAFCRRRAGATTVRSLLRYSWARESRGSADEGLVVATVVADAFCHSMVRALVGALLPVGEGRRDVGWPAQVLAAGVRDPAVAVVAAHGLTLEQVEYPADEELAARARQARAVRTLPRPPF